jgi:hypothetical protein
MDRSPWATRRREVAPSVEGLEPRLELTGGLGSQFAEISGTIATPGGSVEIPFAINPALFARPNGRILLGIDVSPQSGSDALPRIVEVDNAQGAFVAPALHATYDPAVSRLLNGKTETSASLVSLPAPTGHTAQMFAVRVADTGHAGGAVRVGFYLPGDANGDGAVTPADLGAIRAAMGSHYGDPRYSVDLDTNRDGRVDAADLNLAWSNLGARTIVLPGLAVGVDPSDPMDLTHRTTTAGQILIAGQATPGSVVAAVGESGHTTAVGTVADATGHFRLSVPLTAGTNDPVVTDFDGFGQRATVGFLPLQSKPKPAT